MDFQTHITRLTSQYPQGLLGLPGDPVLLSWQIKSEHSNARQTHYCVEVSGDIEFRNLLTPSNWIESSNQVAISSPAKRLESRETQFFRVRVRTEFGETTWSPILSCEAGLLKQEDWIATAISDNGEFESPSPILRKQIELREHPVSARLFATSMGLNNFYINGERVGDGLLSPGWTSYQSRLLVETHDVTTHLKSGANVLASELSDGWWRGKLGFFGGSQHYGKDLGLLAQLEVTYPDGSIEKFATDATWKCSTAEIVFSSIYDGTTIEFSKAQRGWKSNGFDDSHWRSVSQKRLPLSTLSQRITEPVRVIEILPMSIEEKTDRYLLRGSQNISGWVRLVVQGKKGQTVVVRHAEVLEPGDKLHTVALRSAKATDTYILDSDGEFVLEPEFTFHGFQFADVRTKCKIVSAEAVAISSGLEPRGRFWSSSKLLNKLHENVRWSQMDNFVSLPTDCPQRDERMGWTGDAQAFATTANTLFDTASFFTSWLIDLEIDQYPNGDVSAVVPDILKMYPQDGDWIFEGRAGWGDAATIVPMSLYESFGDKSILDRQLNSMRRWTNALDRRRQGENFLPEEFQFGDWCDPDAPLDKPWQSKVSPHFVANSYFANTASLMARAEDLVGDPHLASHYRALAEELKRNIWQYLGQQAIQTTAGCSIALEFDLVPLGQRDLVAKQLAKLVSDDQGKISTGFLATPLVLHALSKNGHTDLAYKMLLRREFRSWLYAVENGATTVWERWDAIGEDGSINTGGASPDDSGDGGSSMISFNHYAYGAVIDWVYRNVAGLSPSMDSPGYRKILISPKPSLEITHAGASIQTPFGEAVIDWQLDGSSSLSARILIPFGATGELNLSVREGSKIMVDGAEVQNKTELSCGEHQLLLSDPVIF